MQVSRKRGDTRAAVASTPLGLPELHRVMGTDAQLQVGGQTEVRRRGRDARAAFAAASLGLLGVRRQMPRTAARQAGCVQFEWER